MTCDDSGIHLGEILSIEFSDPALLFLRRDEEKERGSEVAGCRLLDLSDRLLPRCDEDPVGLIGLLCAVGESLAIERISSSFSFSTGRSLNFLQEYRFFASSENSILLRAMPPFLLSRIKS